MTAPMSDDDRRRLERVLALVREVLGADLRGAYLFGSAVLGGLRPRSDLDVLAVSARPTTPDHRRRIVDRLLALSGRQGRRVELTVVVESAIRPWRYPPAMDFQYGDWLRAEFERGDHLVDAPPTANPDLATLIALARRGNTPLLGPPADEMFDPVPPEDLVRAMLAGIGPLRDDLATDTTNVLLTFARIWSSLATGEILSKDAAADWAAGRLPEALRPPITRARAVYLGEADDDWDDLRPEVEAHAAHVLDRIRSAAPQSLAP